MAQRLRILLLRDPPLAYRGGSLSLEPEPPRLLSQDTNPELQYVERGCLPFP